MHTFKQTILSSPIRDRLGSKPSSAYRKESCKGVHKTNNGNTMVNMRKVRNLKVLKFCKFDLAEQKILYQEKINIIFQLLFNKIYQIATQNQ